MEITIKEPVEKRLKTTFILVFLLFVICFITPYIKLPVIPAILPFIYAVFCCFYLIKYSLSEYKYILGEETFKIEKGKDYKKTVILNIPFKDIISLKKENIKAKNLTVSPFSKDYMVLTYKIKGEEKKVKIHYTENLRKELEVRIYE